MDMLCDDIFQSNKRYNIHKKDSILDTKTMAKIELEKDTGMIIFMQNFYKKYCVLFHSLNEAEKARKLKVKMKINEDEYVYITREELDRSITHFRAIYKSFFSLKTFIDPTEVNSFDRQYNINNYFLLNKAYPEVLVIEKDPFNLVWVLDEEGKIDELSK